MSLLTLCQVLSVLLIFTAVLAAKTGKCEHPCEACAKKRESDREKQKQLQHEYWHPRMGGVKDCESCKQDPPPDA